MSLHIGNIICPSSNFWILFLRICNANGSISILTINLGRKNAEAMESLPVPAPKSKIILLCISLNSNPAKYIISAALFASIQYCSNSTFGSKNDSVF